MKQVDIINACGINKGALSSYLSGRYRPKQIAIHKLANVLNVSEAWLLGYSDTMQSFEATYDKETGILTIPFVSQKLSAGSGEDFLPDEDLEIKSVDVLDTMIKGAVDRSNLLCA